MQIQVLREILIVTEKQAIPNQAPSSVENEATLADAQKPKPMQRVPARIQDKISKLRALETRLGHLPPDEISLTELHKRVADPQFEFHASQLEQQTELLFGDICDELLEAGLSPEQICDVVNERLRYEGGPRYCNVAEVKDCLGIKE